MPIMLYPKCWRNREDCMPIHCIEATDDNLTEEQLMTLDYEVRSFVCCGLVQDKIVEQDAYRLCFKNDDGDDMSDNDIQDLTHLMSVIAQALAFDATIKVNGGTIEVPTLQDINKIGK